MDVKSCGFISHFPTRFKFGWDEEDELCIDLKTVMLQQIQLLRQTGCNNFYMVCDPGAGLWFGELVNVLRNNNPHLLLQCILPHEEVATKWTPELRCRYFALLEKCTHLIAESRPGDPNAMEKALIHMINCCDFVVAVYDPSSRRGDAVDHAMHYLQSSGKPYMLIHPDTLELQGCVVKE